MKFISNVDLIKFFANEYTKPGHKVLLICNELLELIIIKNIFYFINSELIVIDSNPGINVDITYFSINQLPFDDQSFDLIISFKEIKGINSELKRILKQNGKMLIHGMDKISNEIYYVDNKIFNVI